MKSTRAAGTTSRVSGIRAVSLRPRSVVPARSRAGLGLFAGIAAVLVLAALTAQIAVGRFTSSTAASVQKSSVGRRAALLAESSLEAAWVALVRDVNDPTSSSGLYAAFRRDADKGAKNAWQFNISVDALPGVGEWFADRKDSGLAFNPKVVQAEVLWERPFPTSAMPYQKLGRVRLTARVEASWLGVSRTISQERTLRVVLTSTPRPFGGMTFWLDDARGVVIPGRDANTIQQIPVGRQRVIQAGQRHLQQLQDMRKRVADNAGVMGMMGIDAGALEAEMDAKIAQVQQQIATAQATATPDMSAYFKAVQGAVGAPDDEQHAPVMFTDRAQVNLADLNFQQERLQPLTKRIDDDWTTYVALDRDLDRLRNSDDPGRMIAEGRVLSNAIQQTLTDLDGAYLNVAATYSAIGQNYRILAGDDAAAAHAQFDYKLSPTHWEQTAVYRTQGLFGLVDRIAGRSRGLTGIVYAQGPTGALAQSSFFKAYRGQSVVAVTDAVRLDGVAPASASDLLTVVALGPARLSESAAASVVAVGDTELADGGQLMGNLVLGHLSGKAPNFTIIRNAAYYSGVTGPGANADHELIQRDAVLFLPVKQVEDLKRA